VREQPPEQLQVGGLEGSVPRATVQTVDRRHAVALEQPIAGDEPGVVREQEVVVELIAADEISVEMVVAGEGRSHRHVHHQPQPRVDRPVVGDVWRIHVRKAVAHQRRHRRAAFHVPNLQVAADARAEIAQGGEGGRPSGVVDRGLVELAHRPVERLRRDPLAPRGHGPCATCSARAAPFPARLMPQPLVAR
jgi:hypothetical protein